LNSLSNILSLCNVCGNVFGSINADIGSLGDVFRNVCSYVSGMVGSRVNLGSNSFVCSLVGHLAFRDVNCFVRSNIGCLI